MRVEEKDYLLREGESADEYYCLESGLVQSFANSSEGKEVTTGFFSPHEIVIEVASLFLRVPTKENIQTLSDCMCWKISLKSFDRLLSNTSLLISHASLSF